MGQGCQVPSWDGTRCSATKAQRHSYPSWRRGPRSLLITYALLTGLKGKSRPAPPPFVGDKQMGG